MRDDSRVSFSHKNGNDFGNPNIEDYESVMREFSEEVKHPPPSLTALVGAWEM